MDRFPFVRDNGVVRLPPGFRFQPTDEELLFQYLKCKIFSSPLPAPIIQEMNIYKYDPWDLPGNMKQERYFFSNKETKYPNGNRINRATASGYWKATGVDKQIVSSSRNNRMVGMKKTLVFYRGKSPNESRTDWIMHEYRLVNASSMFSSTQNYPKQMENWVICRIFMKKRSRKDGNQIIQTRNGKVARQPQLHDFMTREKRSSSPAISSSSSSSCPGGMSGVSSNGSSYGREGSSSRNVF
ncbi:NAC domain-containing protein 83-like [Mangifera indica]|uniref:NAC domain-containing protein 83-like n=1 Tax=Mangifera indica TaxID=29780 RepID=UPI001CFACC40|nr:NAC domain-containing protein 83-like [Mangifera indica]